MPEDSLLVAKFDLPPEFAWFNELNVQERIDFFVGLLEVSARPELTLPDGRQRTLMDALNEYLCGWQATVELFQSGDSRGNSRCREGTVQRALLLRRGGPG
ncbi:MAG TPA: hypothetical protein EYP49_14535 [Anaerolineae bacterium]|nr:hypothetical protein [Anaerolineae bacterium]